MHVNCRLLPVLIIVICLIIPNNLASSQSAPYTPPSRWWLSLRPTADGLHYTFPVAVGTPPQNLSVILDTGSDNLIILTNPTSSSSICSTPPSYPFPVSCFTPSASITYSSTGQRTTYNLEDDNEILDDPTCVISYDKLTIKFPYLGTTNATTISNRIVTFVASSSPVITPYKSQLAVGNQTQPLFNTLQGVSGILGVNYPQGSVGGQQSFVPFLSLLGALSPPNAMPSLPLFGLDLKGPTDSYIQLLGIDDFYQNKLNWAGPCSDYYCKLYNEDGSYQQFHGFQMYELSLCGVNLFSGQGFTAVTSIVDSGSSCLSLPAEIYDAFISWLPVQCFYVSYGDNLNTYGTQGGPKTCYLPSQIPVDLPTLKFSLRSGGPSLYINLTDLIVDTHTSPSIYGRLCVVRGISLYYGGLVSLGARVLRSFYVAFSMSTNQVGLANRINAIESNVQCRPKVICRGMQSYSSNTNGCTDPPCDQYYFFELDLDSKTCVLTSSFHAMASVIIAVFILLEFFLQEYFDNLGEKITKHVPLN